MYSRSPLKDRNYQEEISSSENEEYFPELERLKGENQRKDQLISFLHDRLLTTPKPKAALRLRPSPAVENHIHRRIGFEVERRKKVAENLELLASEIERELSRR